MRAQCPVHQVQLADGHDAWLVLGHDAARQALKDPRLSKDMLAALEARSRRRRRRPARPGTSRVTCWPLTAATTRRLRHLVSRAFAPPRDRRAGALDRAHRRPSCSTSSRPLGPGRSSTWSPASRTRLPFRVISELLGVPAPDHEPAARLVPDVVPTVERVAAARRPSPRRTRSSRYLERLVADHRKRPADDLIGVLVTASDEYDELTQQELLSRLFQLIVAGHDTTTSLIGNSDGGAARPSRSAPSVARQTGAGCRRRSRSSSGSRRRSRTRRSGSRPSRSSSGGVEIPASKQVLVCLGGANHDPSVRDNPQLLDISRPPKTHLGFGFGPHFCLGVHLARLEGRVAFERAVRALSPAASRRPPQRAALGPRRRPRVAGPRRAACPPHPQPLNCPQPPKEFLP